MKRYVVTQLAVALAAYPLLVGTVLLFDVRSPWAGLLGMTFGVVAIVLGVFLWARWEVSRR
jgi:hypothetical protein